MSIRQCIARARTHRGLVGFALLCVGFAFLVAAPASAASGKRRPLVIEDAFALGDVGDPQISPDGRWIAYTVTTSDLEADETRTRIWMLAAAGGDAIPMSAEDWDSSSPRWSPDGKYLAFLSARGDDEAHADQAQVFTLFREGGEAVQRTDTAQGVEFFAWSPDGQRMLLALRDPRPAELAAKAARDAGESYEAETPPPWVITRRQFKQDYVGYVDAHYTHLYVLDLASGDIRQITSGNTDDYCQLYLPGCDASEPAWSPDGSRIAFVSNRTDDPDANYNTDIFVVEADNKDRGARAKRITDNPGPDAAPSWSPDGKQIAHTSNISTNNALYTTHHLAVSSAAGGGSKLLTQSLDRMVFKPRFSRLDASIYFLLEDSGEQSLARAAASGGEVERVVAGARVVSDFAEGPGGELALLVSEPQFPAELFLFDKGALVRRSHVNDAALAKLQLGAVEEIRFASADGTVIEAFVVKPPGFAAGRRYPAILDIHGGPQAQYDHSFNFEAQLFAANGYVVVLPNPRGSTGYGEPFCMAIWQDWGGPDYYDVMAAVDSIVDKGWADPKRLAVTGWSYGGILTDHIITKTDRFKAAATGASAALYVVNFAHDHYQRWWMFELGPPWEAESRERYEKISPFNQLDKVVTPTLVLGGQLDMNVPIINSEQLYLGLKIRGVPTELVIYPGEYHGIDTPSHIVDLYQRYLAWFGKYVGGKR